MEELRQILGEKIKKKKGFWLNGEGGGGAVFWGQKAEEKRGAWPARRGGASQGGA